LKNCDNGTVKRICTIKQQEAKQEEAVIKGIFARHCEPSGEAIQSVHWIASSLRSSQ